MKKWLKILAVPSIILAGLMQFAAAVWWLKEYRFFFNSAMLGWSLDYAMEFSSGGMENWLALAKNSSYYAPGYEALAGLVHFYFGFSRENFAAINYIALTISALCIYGIGKKISGHFLGWLAAWAFLFFPAVYVFGRVPSREIALICAVSLCAFALYYSNRFHRRGPAILFALAFSLGMMLKWTFIGYFFFPIVYFFIGNMAKGISEGAPVATLGLTKGQWANMIAAAALIFACLAPWYLGALDWQYLSRSSGNDPTEYTTFFEYYGFYLNIFSHYAQRPHYWVYLLALAALGMFGANRKKQGLVMVWLVAAYLIYALIPHKESRTLFPMLPAFMILAASGIDTIPKTAVKAALAGLIAIAAVLQFLSLTFEHPLLPTDAGDFFFLDNPECGKTTDSAFAQLVETLEIHTRAEKGEQIIFGSHPFNHDTLYFSDDSNGFQLRRLQATTGKTNLRIAGYGPVDYERFYRELGTVEFLVLDRKLYGLTEAQMQANIEAWRAFETSVKQDKQSVPMDDPGFLRTINQKYTKIATIKAPCLDPLDILQVDTLQ